MLMMYKMSAGRSRYFLFLVIGVLNIFNPMIIEAQNISAANLAGTEWSTGETVFPNAYLDNSVTTITRYLIFYKLGKVEAKIVIQKSAGIKSEVATEYISESYYNGATGRYEYQTVPRQVQKFVNTMPEFSSDVWSGTYEIKGKSVSLDFPSCALEANLSGNLLKSIAFYKGSKEKEVWTLAPLSAKQNNSTSGNSNSGTIEKPASDSSAIILEAFRKRKAKQLEKLSSVITGNWEGTYSCGQGLTNLNLSISLNNSSEISAVFKFSADSNNPSVASGSYRMIGSYNEKTNKIILKATDWISQPQGYVTVDLVGTVSSGNTKMSGDIINSVCTTFNLEKR